MLAKLARIILALATFPLIGAYGLRWAGGFMVQTLGATGVLPRPLMVLDIVGGIAGLALGVILAVQIVGCALQAESSPVRPAADGILIILGLLLVADVAIVKACGGAEWVRWLPAGNLVVWVSVAAATASLHGARRRWRQRLHEAPPPLVPLPTPPPGPHGV